MKSFLTRILLRLGPTRRWLLRRVAKQVWQRCGIHLRADRHQGPFAEVAFKNRRKP